MISALACKVNNLNDIDEYCTEKIQPLLMEKIGHPIYFGKYNVNGEISYYITKIYANKPPELRSLGQPKVHPFSIKAFLEELGYSVEWVRVKEIYPAGYLASKKTRYYSEGYNTYYSLKISC